MGQRGVAAPEAVSPACGAARAPNNSVSHHLPGTEKTSVNGTAVDISLRESTIDPNKD